MVATFVAVPVGLFLYPVPARLKDYLTDLLGYQVISLAKVIVWVRSSSVVAAYSVKRIDQGVACIAVLLLSEMVSQADPLPPPNPCHL